MSLAQRIHGAMRRLKNFLVGGAGRSPRRVWSGLYRGLRLELDPASETQILLGLWERETYSWIRRGTRHCQWAVDAGAGKGELSIYLLRASPARTVLAFEPLKRETEIFERNLELNGLAGTPRLKLSNRLVGSPAEPEFVALDALALDRRARGFLKIDVEGAEADVLQSGQELLREADVSILVETHAAQSEDECARFLSGLGYRVKIIPNAWWRLLVPEYRPIPHNRWLWAERAAPVRNDAGQEE